MSDLTIESVETIPIRVELNRQYAGSYYAMRNRCTIVTRVRTVGGLVGEIYNADTDKEQLEIVGIINNELAPLVVGEEILAVERCWERMLRPTYDQLRDRRLVMQAISSVDSAIWDAVGRAYEAPLYRLWGGYRSSVPLIGIGGYYETGADGERTLEEEVGFFAGIGAVGMKFKIGGAAPKVDADRLQRAVAAAPKAFRFIVDANQGYNYQEAIEFVRLVERFVDLRWFEEPCRWYNDRRWMRDFRLATRIPVAAGQSEISAAGARELIEHGAIDVCNFDASWGGGPTQWRRVAAHASLYGVEMGHHEEAHIASHLLAGIPNGTFVEVFHPERDPIYWNLLANRSELVDGNLPLPSGPGFGWELDRGFIEKHRVN
jgi:D-galactarolactone cycloisomerase